MNAIPGTVRVYGSLGVVLQLLSIAAALKGFGVLSLALASSGVALVSIGLKTVSSYSGGGWGYILASIILYSFLTPIIAVLSFGNSSLQVFVAIMILPLLLCQIMYVLGYRRALQRFRFADRGLDNLCRALLVMNSVAALLACSQLMLFAFSIGTLKWIYPALSIFLAIFIGTKILELAIWIRMGNISLRDLGRYSTILWIGLVLTLLGASFIAAENVNTMQLLVNNEEAMSLGQQQPFMSSLEEVIKVYSEGPALLQIGWGKRILAFKTPYYVAYTRGCSFIWICTKCAILCEGTAYVSPSQVVLDEFIYGPLLERHIHREVFGTHRVSITMLSSSIVKPIKATELHIVYVGKPYGVARNVSLKKLHILITILSKERKIVLNPLLKSSELQDIAVNGFFNVSFSATPSFALEGFYILRYAIEVDGPACKEHLHAFYRCLEPPILAPTLPPYALMVSESINSNAMIVPYPVIFMVVGLGAIVAYVMLLLRTP